MSTYLGRIRRVATGWKMIPGKNLVVFDDAIVEARASALDGAPFAAMVGGVAGGAVGAAVGAGIAAAAARRRNRPGGSSKWALATPQGLLGQHPENWMIETSAITTAILEKHRVALSPMRRLRFATADGTRAVVYEPRPNPDAVVAEMMRRALGDKFTVAI